MRWEVIDDRHAILWGSLDGLKYWVPVAVITYAPENLEDYLDDCWRVASVKYNALNFAEEDTTIPLKQIQKRVMILLGQAILNERGAVEQRLQDTYRCMMEAEK